MNNLRLFSPNGFAIKLTRDEQLSSKYRREINVPGLGLLFEQNPLADRPISLGARRAFSFWSGSLDKCETCGTPFGQSETKPEQIGGDQTDLHRYQRLHRALCCCYTMITIEMACRAEAGRRRLEPLGRDVDDGLKNAAHPLSLSVL